MTVSNRLACLLDTLATERAVPCQHLESDDAKGPKVRAVRGLLGLEHLGCKVLLSTDELIVVAAVLKFVIIQALK